MAKFTQTQINASMIMEAAKQSRGGAFVQWKFSVKDDNGIIYEWHDSSLSENATTDQITDAISAYLLDEEKAEAAPTALTSVSVNNITSQKIGDL